MPAINKKVIWNPEYTLYSAISGLFLPRCWPTSTEIAIPVPIIGIKASVLMFNAMFVAARFIVPSLPINRRFSESKSSNQDTTQQYSTNNYNRYSLYNSFHNSFFIQDYQSSSSQINKTEQSQQKLLES